MRLGFNRLTGLRQTTGNFPGVTVEKHTGRVQLGDTALDLIDLPGIYCLSGASADGRIAVDVLLGRVIEMDLGRRVLLARLGLAHLCQRCISQRRRCLQ